MQRIVDDFRFPVVYPNGAVVYCSSQEEQEKMQAEIKEWLEK